MSILISMLYVVFLHNGFKIIQVQVQVNNVESIVQEYGNNGINASSLGVRTRLGRGGEGLVYKLCMWTVIRAWLFAACNIGRGSSDICCPTSVGAAPLNNFALICALIWKLMSVNKDKLYHTVKAAIRHYYCPI